jgi:hypothetical protein
VREIKFGTQLGLAERRWVVDRINEHLGISEEEDEDEEDEDT